MNDAAPNARLQITVPAAVNLASRLVARYGKPLAHPQAKQRLRGCLAFQGGAKYYLLGARCSLIALMRCGLLMVRTISAITRISACGHSSI